jgi:putative ABC transport system ATP-binding protein
MSLLALEHVNKTVREAGRQVHVLRDLTMSVEQGEYIVVWGLRSSGRSTLLRIAAGIENPDSGSVRFGGRDVRQGGELGDGIGYCQKRFGSGECRSVRDQVTMGLLARGTAPPTARRMASDAMKRCGIHEIAGATLAELDRAELVQLALARTLTLQPRLLVIDEPSSAVELAARDQILALLRSIADEGIAVLASAAESTGLSGADRTLALSEGELRGALEPRLAPVVPLRRIA